ncbi:MULTISPECIES: YbaM family protein [unclassified Motilimonas]|uniref:YbaM family protein n=1 Tax=Motilimonas TaxID=1914248 RepID=UPI001E59401C|nr:MULTISPECIES: YbaM family protein [unclassified Motilimonas]MCE0556367.1 YbaM family protein [Motilimonas sp. E26]MDO6525863.1 YbaM family protein [Motilimonas sp. 1_MG-2023]
MSLTNAPKHIQLAVDLIQLLEENQIDMNTAVAALEVVLTDCKNKQASNNKAS